MLSAGIVVEVALHSAAGLFAECGAIELVERCQQRYFASVEVMEADVDAAVGGYQVAVCDAAAQQSFDAVGPVFDQPVGADVLAPHAVSVREHRDRRLDHGHRVAVGERHGGVRECVDQRAELLTVLRRLEHPLAWPAQEGQRLEHGAQVAVMRTLIQAQVVVAPRRHPRVPLQDVAGEVEVEELDLLLDGRREPVVHGLGERRCLLDHLVLGDAAGVSGVDTVHVGPLAAQRERLLAFPVGQCPAARIDGDQVNQMRCAGTG